MEGGEVVKGEEGEVEEYEKRGRWRKKERAKWNQKVNEMEEGEEDKDEKRRR